ncbi:MAG: RrF2 family transcriptional regulator, partial [Elusimicrobiota bacterium]
MGLTNPVNDTKIVSDMQLLTKETDYAVRALMCMASEKEAYKSARDISREENIPYQFIRRILNKLKEAEFVKTREGPRGGVKLMRQPDKIKVIDVIETLQGDIKLSKCMFKDDICPNRSKCVIRNHITEIEKMVAGEFKNITIGSLLEEK